MKSIGILLIVNGFYLSRAFLSRPRRQHRIKQSLLHIAVPARISLADALEKQGTSRFIDATWYHKGNSDPRASFEQGPRISGSVYFDLDDICDDNDDSSLSHMFPSGGLLEAWMEYNRIRPGVDHLILYGQQGSWFLPRVWFTFRSLGHTQVSIMEADLNEWTERGGAVEELALTSIRKNAFKIKKYPSRLHEKAQHVVDLETMKQVVGRHDTIILDARGSSFAQDGHMPDALHLPYSSLSDTVRFHNNLRDRFLEIGVNPLDESKQIICTCGSGVSACTLYLAVYECGRRDGMFVYDGSWQEWKSHPDLPKVKPSL